MKPIDEDGTTLDAEYQITPSGSGFDLLLESRSGSQRNRQYATALYLLLSRAAAIGAVLDEAEVASREAATMPAGDRRVEAASYPFFVALASVDDLERLRIELGRAVQAVGRAPGVTGGNPTKRLRLRLRCDRYQGDARELVDVPS